MHLIAFKVLFCIIGALFSILLTCRIIFNSKFQNNNKLSPLIAFMGGLLLFYSLIGIILAAVYPNILKKIILFIFAISPFLIGKLVCYKKLTFYSIIQILCVILSIGFIIIF